jgi:uncharacterized protein (DUF983 family)
MSAPGKQLPSKFSSLLKCKCPRCRQGNIFQYKSTDLKNYRKMNEYCPVCGLRYELEVGFFWGAMYVGYALNIAISVPLGILVFLLFKNPDTWVYISVIVAAILLASPFNFRYARAILLYAFAPSFKNSDTKVDREVNNKSNPNLN